MSARVAHAEGRAAVVRRGVEGALRRGRADATRVAFPGDPRSPREALPGQRAAGRPLRRLAQPFVIPREKLDTVFKAAIAACRERTAAHVTLPAERAASPSSTSPNKSWSGYNWYQGNFRSLIQVNTDLPIYIDRAIDLACHEGYPGHHVYNALLEQHLVQRPRLDRVHGLSALHAAVADRGRHGQLRHRGRVPGPRAHRVRDRRCSFPPPASTRRGRRSTTRCRRWSSSCRTPATKRRGATSTARSTRRGRGLARALRADAAASAPRSACGSSTSTAATSSTTTTARTWSARYIESRGGTAATRRSGGRSSRSCCRRRGCRRR